MRDWNAPIPKEAQVLKEDGSVDLNVREISPEEFAFHQKHQRAKGAYVEEARTAYLMRMASLGKIHHSLLDKIETNHVTPAPLVIERAEKAFLRGTTIERVKEKFKEMFATIFKPQHAEIVAEAIRKTINEK